MYACSMLAIDAQGLEITTIESLGENGELEPLQQAFVNADASQCGYCTSGFVMSAKAFLDENPAPTLDDIKKGMCGNLCRCGTYAGIAEALLAMSQTQSPVRNAGGLMVDYNWPASADRKLIGTDVLRIDSPFKVSGKAQYTTDVQLAQHVVRDHGALPPRSREDHKHRHSAAAKSPGCKAVYVIQKPGTEIFWAGDDVVAVAAVDELSAAQAAKAVKVQYKALPHLVVDSNPNAPAGFSQPMQPETLGDVDSAFQHATSRDRANLFDACHHSLLPRASRQRGDVDRFLARSLHLDAISIGNCDPTEQSPESAGQQDSSARRIRRRWLRSKTGRGPMGTCGCAFVQTSRGSAGALGGRSPHRATNRWLQALRLRDHQDRF